MVDITSPLPFERWRKYNGKTDMMADSAIAVATHVQNIFVYEK